jgi:hypothetical protein
MGNFPNSALYAVCPMIAGEDARADEVRSKNCKVSYRKGSHGDLPHVPLVLAERMIPLRRGLEPTALSTGASGRMTLPTEGRAAGRGHRFADRINVIMVGLLPREQKHVLVTFRWTIRKPTLRLRIWLRPNNGTATCDPTQKSFFQRAAVPIRVTLPDENRDDPHI